ncbi:MAG: biosynthetic-type acetolactate synthase large subunit [Proteobacteria bacterium]|nr:biosynthetic-type acetolactate synthase large subunit [Pseudomonadota bacterium]
MKKTGAQILLESLKLEGVDILFGYPGGAVLDIYNELFDFPIKHILVRHEQAAVHAADGYARATGRAGACLVTSGPGATNTVTGIATAYMDSIPVVIFSGQVPSALIGNDAFQEADIVGITRPCTKHNYLVKDVTQLARIIKEAFYIATTGRPGPVLVDIPKDILQAQADFHYPEKVKMRSYNPNYEGHHGQVAKAVKLIMKAEKPVVYAGGGVVLSNAAEELTEFSRLLNIPTTTTLMGLGGFPEDDDLALGMLGMHGTYRANMAVTHCDLLIAVGARFDDRVTGKLEHFAAGAKIIHIDIDPTSISKNVKVDVPIVGDVRDVLQKLIKSVAEEDIENFKKTLAPWNKEAAEWKATYPLAYKQKKGVIKPQYVVEKISELAGDDAIISTEVGQNQMWTAQYYKFKKPRTFLTSGGLGTMGYGFPAAIGAQAAYPDRLVIDIAGDGSIQMNIQELATVMQYRLPVKIAILNNHFLGMVRQWQELFYDKRYSSTCMQVQPDFVKLAEAYGAKGLRAKKHEDVEKVIKEAFATEGPVLMEFIVDQEEDVYPMVPAGKSISEMLLV